MRKGKLGSLAVPLLAFALAFACAPAALAAPAQDTLQGQGLIAQGLKAQADDDSLGEETTITLKKSSLPYTGKEIKPDFTVPIAGKTYSRSQGEEVTEDDFKGLDDDQLVGRLFTLLGENTFIYMYENDINVNNAKAGADYQPNVSVLALTNDEYGFWSGVAYYNITPAPIASAVFPSISAKNYTGKAIQPKVAVTFNKVKLAQGADYTVKYSNNKNAGTASITFTGKGNFKGTKTLKFKINKVAITKAAFSKIKSQTYTGKTIKPSVTVRYNGKKLKKGTDYTIKYSKNKEVGTAKVVIAGKGNFKGKKTIKFTIKKASINNATISSVSNKTYKGSAWKPSPTVRLNGKKLKKGTDYTVKYSNNTNAGIAKIKITGKGNMKGTRTVDFVINPYDISGNKVKASIDSATWTGGFVSPSYLTLKFNGKNLTSSNYSVFYSNNVNVGTNSAQAYISAKGNFTGSRTLYFSINAHNIGATDVSAWTPSKVYMPGSNPMPLVMYNGRYLAYNVDYTLGWGAETNGTGTITIRGIGHFQGTRTVTYSVYTPKSTTTNPTS